MKRICQFAVLALVAWPVAVHAQGSKNGKYRVLAYGAMSCGEWTEHRHSGDWPGVVVGGWVLGFLTSYNRYGPGSNDISKGIDDDAALLAWVDTYCVQHPLDDISMTAEKLIGELEKRATH